MPLGNTQAVIACAFWLLEPMALVFQGPVSYTHLTLPTNREV